MIATYNCVGICCDGACKYFIVVRVAADSFGKWGRYNGCDEVSIVSKQCRDRETGDVNALSESRTQYDLGQFTQ